MNREDARRAGYVDVGRVCADCGDGFLWTAGEQLFFADKGFTAPPRRCAPCRERKRPHSIAGRRRWQPQP